MKHFQHPSHQSHEWVFRDIS